MIRRRFLEDFSADSVKFHRERASVNIFGCMLSLLWHVVCCRKDRYYCV